MNVSVPFAMGTALLGKCHGISVRYLRFSPLRYGDSIVGHELAPAAPDRVRVSVPFAMGTALLDRATGAAGYRTKFQSPSLWGQHCWIRFPHGAP